MSYGRITTVVALSLLALSYGTIVYAPLVFDDVLVLGPTGIVSTIPSLTALWHYMPSRFVPHLTFFFPYAPGLRTTMVFHIANLMLHGVAGYLVYQFVGDLMHKAKQSSHVRQILPVVVTLLFLLHPIQTESVTYIYQRSTIIAACFILATLHLSLRYAASKKKNIMLLLTTIACCLAALHSKETAYILPALVGGTFWVWSVYRRKDSLLIGAIVLTTMGMITVLSTTNFAGKPVHGFTHLIGEHAIYDKPSSYRIDYLLTQINVTARYVRVLLWPVDQTIDYDIPLAHSLRDILPGALFTHAILLGIGIYFWKKNRLISYGIGWFYLTLSVESSILALNDIAFEHRMYLPSLGIWLALGTLTLRYLSDKKRPILRYLVGGSIVLSIILVTIQTYRRNQVWRDPVLLFSDAVQKAPRKFRPRNNLAYTYERKGEYAEAIREYKIAASLDETQRAPLVSMGNIYVHMNRYPQAVELYQQALRRQGRGDDREVRSNLGVAYLRMQEFSLAQETFEALVTQYPDMATGFYHLGVIYDVQGKPDLSAQSFSKALATAASRPSLARQIDADIREWKTNAARYRQ